MDVKSQSNKARARSRPRLSPATMTWVRKLHLYTGVLFAPTILFFAFTGILQIYDLHEPNPATGAAPSALIARMGNLHKNQTFALPAKDRPKDRAKAKGQGAGMGQMGAPEARPAPRPLTIGRLLLKAFAAAAAVGLAVTTLFGLYMAYALHRNPWLVGGLVAAGVVVPLVLAWGAGG